MAKNNTAFSNSIAYASVEHGIVEYACLRTEHEKPTCFITLLKQGALPFLQKRVLSISEQFTPESCSSPSVE